MNERPIIFSSPMIKAILDGRKTQTRRIMKPAHVTWAESILPNFLDGKWDERPLPYGKPGDRLWVRETWLDAWAQNLPATSVQYHFRADPGLDHYGYKWRPAIHMPREASRILLEVTDVRAERLWDITEVDSAAEGVEPLKSGRGYYSIEHGKAAVHFGVYHDFARQAFIELWSTINGAGSWDANPWVWAISFKVLGTSGGRVAA